jgi:hypothetical protein
MHEYETPDRTIEQRMEALGKANRHRVIRAAWKKQAKRGEVSVPQLVLEPPPEFESMKVFDVLMAIPHWGRSKTTTVMRVAGVSMAKTIDGMTERQCRELVALMPRPRSAGSRGTVRK